VAYQLTRDELVERLREQLRFLESSAQSFDQGYEDEAARLALSIRVLLHDTPNSKSLLGLLGEKQNLKFLDTAGTINPNNLLSTAGFVMMRVGPEGVRYLPNLDDLPPPRMNKLPKPFAPWWNDPVTKDQNGTLFSRRDYVLALANKGGGGHVDPSLNQDWADLTRDNSLGWFSFTGDGAATPVGNPAPASVRQIAHEVDRTIRDQVSHLL
jgi:hypothetical protein